MPGNRQKQVLNTRLDRALSKNPFGPIWQLDHSALAGHPRGGNARGLGLPVARGISITPEPGRSYAPSGAGLSAVLPTAGDCHHPDEGQVDRLWPAP